jgi:light-regulated signal transduction histidine kinase (bacteriophytochrome)
MNFRGADSNNARKKWTLHIFQLGFFIIPLLLVFLEAKSYLYDYALGTAYIAFLLLGSRVLKGNNLIIYTIYLSALSTVVYFFEPHPMTLHYAEIANHITRIIILWIVTALLTNLDKKHDRIRHINTTLSTLVHTQRQAQEEITQRQTQLENVNSELESFAYAVSHDLRAPLRSIDGFSLAMLEDYETKLDDQGKDFLYRIRANTQKMGDLIDAILRLSRQTRKELHCEPVDLTSLSHTIVTRLQHDEPQRRIQTTIKDDLHVYGDADLLTSAMENLLQNAWKFTRKQPNPHIEVGSEKQRGEKVFYVRDNGAGFDMNHAANLFTPFQRLHSQQEFPGIGIGLSTVKRIIQKHGGRIWANAEPGNGAVFYFTLPRC